MTNFNRRSQVITTGTARSPNRAMLRAVGFKDGDFEAAESLRGHEARQCRE
jgi:dihydroxy-acid dehydratase